MSQMLSNSKPLSHFKEGFHLRTSSPSLMSLNGSLSVARTFVLLESTGCSRCSWKANSFFAKNLPRNTLQKSMCVKRPNVVEIKKMGKLSQREIASTSVHHAHEDPSIELMFHSAPRVRKNKYDESIVLQTSLLSYEIHVSVLAVNAWVVTMTSSPAQSNSTDPCAICDKWIKIFTRRSSDTACESCPIVFVYKMNTARKAGEWN